jgi:hypothetical protein
MTNIHAVCETTNLKAVKYAERIWDGVSTENIDNGTLGYIEELSVDGGVIYNFKTGTKEGSPVVLVHSPEWDADTCRITNQRKDKFYNEAGTPFRCYTLSVGDEFAISAEGFTPATAENAEVGKFVTIDATGKLVVGDTATEGAAMVGKIMRTRVQGGVITTAAHNYGHSRKMYEIKVNTLA